MRASLIGVLACALALLAAGHAPAHTRLLAPKGRCAGETRLNAANLVQKRAMRCLTNHARKKAGVRRLRSTAKLNRAARKRTRQIVRCRKLSHTPCGGSFLRVYSSVGYGSGSWSVGENIAWGAGRRGSARRIFHGWLHSSGHRGVLLRSSWRQLGVSRRHRAHLFGRRNVSVWAASYGRP